MALLLADKANLSPVTSSSPDHGSAIISMLAGSAPADDAHKGALVSLTMKGLVVDPAAKIDAILKFKCKRSNFLTKPSAQGRGAETGLHG